jgi:hypothetical protein
LEVYIINSITKSYILNIKIRPLVTEFNPYAYFGHSWSYFDIQNLRLVILYLFFTVNLNNIYLENNQNIQYIKHSKYRQDSETSNYCFYKSVS